MGITQTVRSDDLRVVIIGGGPGGTACALALNRQAAEMNRKIQVTILEGKQFIEERHYNQCVGVLSPPLPSLLEEQLEITFPQQLCLVDIDGYILHSAKEQILLGGEKDGSVAVRRVQFDAYMLDQVIRHGIQVWPVRAVDLEFHADYVMVYTENEPIEADVVVGAFGLDEGSASIFSRLTAYRPPQSLAAIVTKFQLDSCCMEDFGTKIHAFLPNHPQIEFGAITPKCSHLTINIAGNKVDSELMHIFLKLPEVQAVLPSLENSEIDDFKNLHFYKGRFPRSLAGGFYDDRYVMVGDSSGLVRAFKGKGSTTAVITGIRAAETIMKVGITRQAFHDHYRSANQDIIADLPYGKFMRQVTLLISRTNLLDRIIRAAGHSPDLRTALFDAVSGHGTYHDVIGRTIKLGTIREILRAMFQSGG